MPPKFRSREKPMSEEPIAGMRRRMRYLSHPYFRSEADSSEYRELLSKLSVREQTCWSVFGDWNELLERVPFAIVHRDAESWRQLENALGPAGFLWPKLPLAGGEGKSPQDGYECTHDEFAASLSPDNHARLVQWFVGGPLDIHDSVVLSNTITLSDARELIPRQWYEHRPSPSLLEKFNWITSRLQGEQWCAIGISREHASVLVIASPALYPDPA
jgi:hypothetical protein